MLLPLSLLACSKTEDTAAVTPSPPLSAELIAQIDPHNIKAHTDYLADDSLGGRIPGSVGSLVSQAYIIEQMEAVGLQPLGLSDSFIYSYDNSPSGSSWMLDSSGAVVPHDTTEGVDLIGLIPGSDPVLSEEYIVVIAHYDHLGVTAEGEVFNGAFDNAASVGTVLELARVFIDNSVELQRSVLFLITDDEEFGLRGAEAWIQDPTVPQESIIYGVSVDPTGRRNLPDFDPIALMGLERSPQLAAVWKEAAQYIDAPVFQINRDVIPIFASDQDRFFEQDTPALWFTNIGFSFYHTTGDTAETIDYRMVLENAELLAYVLKLTGNTDERYEYLGPMEPDGETAAEALRLIDALVESDYPTSDDKDTADFYREELIAVIEADSHDALSMPIEAFYTGALYYLLFDMPVKYPGEIPPPWPEGW